MYVLERFRVFIGGFDEEGHGLLLHAQECLHLFS